MTPKELKKYYGTGYRFHKETGFSQASLVNWLRWGYIPTFSQLRIERITGGKLKAEWK